jgi:hypothetical protein
MTFSICVTAVVFCNCPDVLLDTSGFWKYCDMCWEDLFKEQRFVVSGVEFSDSHFPYLCRFIKDTSLMSPC